MGSLADTLEIIRGEIYCPWCTDGFDAPAEDCCGCPGCNPEAIEGTDDNG